jgi:predicted enzyme related to lactoylglutathione lyase
MHFERYELRTTHPVDARAFYEALLGSLPTGLAITVLPARAIANGARPHWLGVLGTPRPRDEASVWIARGAVQLGPTRDDGSVVLRDPLGAILALGDARGDDAACVRWRHLNAPDRDASLALYAERCGWSLGDEIAGTRVEGASTGPARVFSSRDGEPPIGSAASILDPQRTHPSWTWFFEVPDLDAALAHVRDTGGVHLPIHRAPFGARSAACDDPQGAAFGLWQTA